MSFSFSVRAGLEDAAHIGALISSYTVLEGP